MKKTNKIILILFGNLHNIYYLCNTGENYTHNMLLIYSNKKRGTSHHD